MKLNVLLACAALGGAALSVAGCSEETAKPFEPGTVAQRTPEAAYPEGPYGVGKGSVIPNYTFKGFANAVAKSDALQDISLGDFYNPHGRDAGWKPAAGEQDTRNFPAGSLYGEGKKKPTVLAIDVASVWCGPCNEEARCVLPVHQARYAPCQGGLFLQLQDGATPGKAATPTNLVNWTAKKYKEDFPAVIDPQGRLGTIFAADAFPQNILVDTTTMRIIEVIAGVPTADYWAKFESLLPEPSCPSDKARCTSDADCTGGLTCSTTCPENAATCVLNACQAANCKSQ